jgi:DNA-binding CsgD family transcriptional regulator/predicted enzyme related to lactoylglutathione lyase
MNKKGRPVHPDSLTPAEWRVVEGVRHGLTNPAIAARLNLSLDAVKFHVSNTLGKLGLGSRRELRQWSGVRADAALAVSKNASDLTQWHVGQISRLTRDVDATSNWLRDIVGLPVSMRFETMTFFDCGGVRLYVSQGDPRTNSLIYFQVADIHSEIERLRTVGVEIISAPHRIHVHQDGTEEWMAFFNDLEGSPLGIMKTVKPNPGEVE